MKRSIGLWELMGFAVTSLVGTLLHFLYDLLGEATWIAPFSGVNESTWEHMKLMFWPMFIFAIVQSFFFKDRGDLFCIKLRGILLGITLIPIIFYTYNGVIGKSPDWVNILIFFLAAIGGYCLELYLFLRDVSCKGQWLAILFFGLMAALFVVFTFAPPTLPIFQDPLTSSYGLR